MSKFKRVALAVSIVLSAALAPTVASAGLKLHYTGVKKGQPTFKTEWVQKLFVGDETRGVVGKLGQWWDNKGFKNIKGAKNYFARAGFDPYTQRALINAKFGQDMILVIKRGNNTKDGVFKLIDKSSGKVLFKRELPGNATTVPLPIAGAGLPMLLAGAGYLVYRRRTPASAAV